MNKSRVIFSAVKSSTLTHFVREIHRTEIPLASLDISPLKLKEVARLSRPVEGCEVLLVVHDRYSHVLVHDGLNFKFVYTMSVGLEQLDAEQGSQMQRSAWYAEINRALKSFQLENRSLRLSTVQLIWDREKMPQLVNQLNDVLTLEAVPFGFPNVARFYLNQTDWNPIHILSLAAVICWVHNIKTDIGADHFLQRFQMKQHVTYRAGAGLLLCLVLGLFTAGYQSRVAKEKAQLRQETQVLEQQIIELKARTEALLEKEKDYMATRERLLAQAGYVQNLKRVSWSYVLSIFAEEMPDELALNSFKFSESGRVNIEGDALRMELVSELMRRIEESETLEQGRFNTLKEREEKKLKFFSFSILAKLKNYGNTTDGQKEN
jgi:Tfp pilus assembly protein PilN